MCYIHQACICPQPIFKLTFWLIDSQSNFFSSPYCMVLQTVADDTCCHFQGQFIAPLWSGIDYMVYCEIKNL